MTDEAWLGANDGAGHRSLKPSLTHRASFAVSILFSLKAFATRLKYLTSLFLLQGTQSLLDIVLWVRSRYFRLNVPAILWPHFLVSGHQSHLPKVELQLCHRFPQNLSWLLVAHIVKNRFLRTTFTANLSLFSSSCALYGNPVLLNLSYYSSRKSFLKC